MDEAPMVYKPMEEIVANIADTVDIITIIKPIYNYKASEQGGTHGSKIQMEYVELRL